MATNSAVTIEDREEMETVAEERKKIDMEMVPERYIDIISGEFAYDPVRLPLDQDPKQLLYNRKTLQTIWETEQHARNPYTRQWFNIKSVIPQTELRKEMKNFVELHKFPSKTVIIEYSKILEEGEMKRHLMKLQKYVEGSPITENRWAKIWKEINLVRLFCEFHHQNIKLFVSLQGFTYLKKVIGKTLAEKDANEAALDVGKEIVRAIDVLLTGLRARGENLNEILGRWDVILGLVGLEDHVYNKNEGYVKIQSMVLRAFSTIFHEIDVRGLGIIEAVVLMGYPCAFKMLCQRNEKDISSEDLNHAFAILRRERVPPHLKIDHLNIDQMIATALGNAVIICISREIERLKPKPEMSGFTEGQLLEAEMQARHNCEALEKGIRVIRDIAMEEGQLATCILTQGLNILQELVHVFQRPTHTENEDDEDGEVPVLNICGKKCETVHCVHYRVARDGLDISESISKKMGTLLDVEILRKFIGDRTGVHAACHNSNTVNR